MGEEGAAGALVIDPDAAQPTPAAAPGSADVLGGSSVIWSAAELLLRLAAFYLLFQVRHGTKEMMQPCRIYLRLISLVPHHRHHGGLLPALPAAVRRPGRRAQPLTRLSFC